MAATAATAWKLGAATTAAMDADTAADGVDVDMADVDGAMVADVAGVVAVGEVVVAATGDENDSSAWTAARGSSVITLLMTLMMAVSLIPDAD